MNITRTALSIALLACVFSNAQADEFPSEATTPTAAEIQKLLTVSPLGAKLEDGTTWRLDYKSNGYFFLDTSKGFSSKGEWKAEDGRLCGQLQGRTYSCNDIRVHMGQLHFKRDTGEIVQFVPK